MKRQTTEWEEVFANHMSNKGPVSRLQIELSKLSSKKRKDTDRKWAGDMKRDSTAGGIQMAHKHITHQGNAE